LSYLSRSAVGRLSEAIEPLDLLTRKNGDEWEDLPAGNPEMRFRIALERDRRVMERLYRTGLTPAAFSAAIISAELDDQEAAMSWLRVVVSRRLAGAVVLSIHPALAPLRSRADFQELVSRVGPRLSPG